MFRNFMILMRIVGLTWFIMRKRKVLTKLKQYARSDPALSRWQRWSPKRIDRYIARVARIWAKRVLKIAEIDLKIFGLENLKFDRSYVIAFNHQSILDALVALSIVPNFRVTPKKNARWIPWLGLAAKRSGQIFLDRHDTEKDILALRTGIETWKEANYIFFVEGTRTRTGALGPFKKGAFHTAHILKKSVLPIAISGAFEALPKGFLLRMKLKPQISVDVGWPIAIRDKTVEELLHDTRHQIQHLLSRALVRQLPR